MRGLKLRGNTVEERFNSLSGVVENLQRSAIGKAVPVIPSLIPISCTSKEVRAGDVLIEYLFPIKGLVTKVASKIEGARLTTINISLDGQDGGQSHKVSIGDGWRSLDVSFEVEANTILTVTVSAVDAKEGVVANMSLSLLFQAAITSGNMIKVGRQQLQLSEEVDEGI